MESKTIIKLVLIIPCFLVLCALILIAMILNVLDLENEEAGIMPVMNRVYQFYGTQRSLR